jgi:hypothetical protein
MADNNQTNIEYLITKVFLYKYTPPFDPVIISNPNPSVPGLVSFDAYATVLNDTLYFTKYDISPFVVSYSVSQNIDETTYSWNLELQDLALSFSTIDNKLKVPAPEGGKTTGLAFSTSTDSITRLAVYEANSDTLRDLTLPIDNIISAKKNRGKGYAGLTVQNPALTGVLPQVPGLRLSDLIQEYDFISVYIYKNTTPITDVVGTFTTNQPPLPNNPLPIFVQGTSTISPPGNGLSPDDPNFKYETVLNSPMLNGQPLFTNDLNGFVTKKTPIRAINQVDRIMLSGNGWSRLFGCTRRLIKPSYLTGALYQQGQLLNAKAVSGFQTVFAGKPISAIVRDLFDLVFRIDFNDISTVNGVTTLDNSFFNISSLIVGNTYPANLFNIPQYLLSCVMKRRAFEYLEPQDITTFALTAPSQISSQVGFTTTNLGIPPEQFQSALAKLSGQVGTLDTFSPVIFDVDVQGLQAYFKFLDSVFTTKFSPDLKTPHEILEEIRKITFVEIFETSYGQFLIRAPQYNNAKIFDPKGEQTATNRLDVSMVRSSTLNIISNTYSETTDNLITKLFTGFSINGLPVVSNLEQFGYCDGKLLDQFGLIESSTVANPNVNLKKSTESSINDNKTNGLFEYCRYLLRILNARLKTMTVVCDFDPSIHVGYTFLDETNYRFGYISNISKQISVTGTATMTLGITYVRDAEFLLGQDNSIVVLNVEQLPVLADLERKFGGK